MEMQRNTNPPRRFIRSRRFFRKKSVMAAPAWLFRLLPELRIPFIHDWNLLWLIEEISPGERDFDGSLLRYNCQVSSHGGYYFLYFTEDVLPGTKICWYYTLQDAEWPRRGYTARQPNTNGVWEEGLSPREYDSWTGWPDAALLRDFEMVSRRCPDGQQLVLPPRVRALVNAAALEDAEDLRSDDEDAVGPGDQ